MAGAKNSGGDIVKAAFDEQNIENAYIPNGNIKDDELEPEVEVTGDSEWDTSGW